MPILKPTNQSVTIVASSNTTQGTSGTQNQSNLIFAGAGNVSVGVTNGSVVISGSVQPGSYNILAAGTQTAGTATTVLLANANNVSFGMSGSNQVTASFSYSQSTAPGAISAGTTQATNGTVVLSNSNGLSFGMNAGTITASYTVPVVPAQTIQTQNMVSVLGSTGNVSFANGNGVSFGGNASTVTASVAAGATATGNFGALGAGTQTATSGTVSFANSNGISFGMSGSNQITASYTVPSVPAQTNQTVGGYAVGNTTGQSSSSTFDARTLSLSGAGNVSIGYSGGAIIISATGGGGGGADGVNILAAGTQTANTTGTVAFINSNNVSFGMSNSSRITASFSYSQSTAPSAMAAGTQTATSGTVLFANSNGISFGMSNSSQITASYTVPTQSIQTQNLVSVLGSTGNISFANSNGVSFGGNASTVTASVGAGATATGNFGALGAGTQTATSGTVSFANSNGISFGMSGSNQITASYTVPTQSVQTQNLVSVLGSTGNISFANGNGVTFGGNASTVTASVAAGATATGNFGALGAGTQTAASGTVSFANSNGISFGMSGSNQITASYTVPAVPAQTNQTAGLYAVGNTVGQSSSSTYDARTVSYSGAGIVSVGHSAGNVIISATQSNQALSGSNGSFAFQTATFGNLNGLSFYTSNGSMVGSYTVPSVPAQTNQTIGGYAIGNTVGQSSSSTFDARTLSISGAGNVSVGYSGGIVIVSAVGAGGGDGGNVLAAGTQTAASTGTVALVNSNNVSFGMSNSSQITASFSYSQSTAPAAISAGAAQATNGTIVLSNSNGISFGMNAGTITASYTVPSVPAQSVQTQNMVSILGSTGNVSFANGNGVTFGGNASTVTASVGAGATATGNFGALGAGTQTATSGTVSFANSNNVSFGMSGSNQVTASFSYSQSTSPAAISAGTTQATNGTIVLSNSNGLSFGMNAGTVTGSYTVPTQTNQTAGLYAVGNTTGQSSSSTYDARTISYSGAGIVSVGNSGGNVIISATQSNQALSGSNGSFTFQTATFGNLNGLSFYTSNGSLVGSYTVPSVPAQTNQTIGGYAIGNTTGQSSSSTFDARTLSLSGAGNISIGYSGGAVIISATGGGGGGGGIANAAGTQTATSGTVAFVNSNGISFGMSNSSQITASYDISALAAGSNITLNSGGSTISIVGNDPVIVSAGTNSKSAGTVLFQNSNGVTFGMSTNGVITASVAGGGGGGGVSPAAGTQTQTSGTVLFQNSNGVTFGMSNSSVITASYDVSQLTAGANITLNVAGSTVSIVADPPLAITAGTNSRSSGTIQFSNLNGVSFGMSTNGIITASHNALTSQSNQQLSVYATGNSTQSSSGTLNASSILFNALGIASIGVSNGSIVVSVPAGGGGGDGVNILAAGTQTANTTGTVLFQNSNGVTFGMSNNSVITASVNPGGGGGVTLSYFNPNDKALQVITHQGNGTLHMQPVQMSNVTYDRIVFPVYISNSSNSTGTVSYSQIFGVYTRTGSTLSLFDSVSTSGTINNSGTANASINNGIRLITMADTGFLSEGQYYMAVINRTSTAGANATFSQVAVSQINSHFSGILGAASNASIQYTRGLGVYTVSTTAMPNSIGFNQLAGSHSAVFRVPIFYFVSQTF